MGGVILDLLRPPTYAALIEAITNGDYHMLVFYGHGGYDPQSGGLLLLEDEAGGSDIITAAALGAALRNTEVRLVLLGACQSAATSSFSTASGRIGSIWSGTAPALVRAGVPLAIGMQVSMRVDAALAFIRQFALSLAAGKSVIEAIGDGRKPLLHGGLGEMWYAPALYGRSLDGYRLFDPRSRLPANTAQLRGEMRKQRTEIERLESAIAGVGVLTQPAEIARLTASARKLSGSPGLVARRGMGGYASVVSPLYGVPENPTFVGRVEELRRVAGAMMGDRPLVIWGAGGIGKSALAAEAARRQSWRFPGGVLWLDCRGGPALDSLLNLIGVFAGVRAIDEVEPDGKEATVRWALAGLQERCLLIWDNAEDVWAERSIQGFVSRLPKNCQALLTTREDPEQAMWTRIELLSLPDSDMRILFERLAVAAGVKIGSQEDAESIPRILEWLQGHPLAMTLIVPLSLKRGLARVWAELQARPLKGIQLALDVSYTRLNAIQRLVFEGLSAFGIPFDWHAMAVLPAWNAESEEALDVLVQVALLQFDGRLYSYHPLVRQFAYAWLSSRLDVRETHARAASYLWNKGSEGITPPEAFEALRQWQKAEDWYEFVAKSVILSHLLRPRGFWSEIEACLLEARRVLSAHLPDENALHIALLSELEALSERRGSWGVAEAYENEALQLARRTGNRNDEARCLLNLGWLLEQQGDCQRADELYTTALAIFEELHDDQGLAGALNNLGGIRLHFGASDEALDLHQRALKALGSDPYDRLAAQTHNHLGHDYASKADWDRAIDAV